MMTPSLLRRLVRRTPMALLALPLAGCMSLADYGEAPGYDGGYDRGYPDYPQEADGWYGRDVASVDVFYTSLDRYGRWDSHPGYGRVFVPVGVGPNWQPYAQGYWANDPRFGRRWVTSEPFGWATYHYGRWARDQRLGWFWVPDTRYGPGWVNWREGSGYSGWSPLPPRGWERWGVGYNPWGWDSWLFAPSIHIYRPGLHDHIVRGRPHYDRTRPVGRPDWQHGGHGGWSGNGRPDGVYRPREDRPAGSRPVVELGEDDDNRPDGVRPNRRDWNREMPGRAAGQRERPVIETGQRERPNWDTGQRERPVRVEGQGRPADRQQGERQPAPAERVERQPIEVRQAAVSQPEPSSRAQSPREADYDRRPSIRDLPQKQPD